MLDDLVDVGRVGGLSICTAFARSVPQCLCAGRVPANKHGCHVLHAIQGFEPRFFISCVQVLQMAQMDGMQNESSQPTDYARDGTSFSSTGGAL